MAAKDLFALAGTITVDSNGAVKNIDKATNAAKQSESKFETSFRRIRDLAVTYLSTTVIWNFGKSMVEAAAAVQAETAQFGAAFKDLSGDATEAFARLEESTGTLATRLQVSGTKAFSQFTGAGMSSADALKQMEQYLTLATDASAYYDLSLEEVDERLRSFLRGNVEAGDMIGLFTSETQRNAAANEKYGKSFIKLSEDQKQLVMLDITKSIYDASGATGQAAREADSYANVVGNLKEQWRQFLAQAGAPLLEAVIPILQTLGSVLQSLAPILTAITQFLVDHKDIIGAIAVGLLAAVTAYGLIKAAIAAYNAITKIASIVTGTHKAVTVAMTAANVKATGATRALTTAQTLLNKAMKANPIGIVVTLIGLLVAAFVALWNKSEAFRNFWKNLWENIKKVAANAWKAIKGFFTSAWNAIKSVWNGAASFFKGVWNGIKSAFSAVGNFFKNVFTSAWNGIKSVWNGVGNFFKNIVNTIVGAFKNIGKKIWDSFTGVFSKIWDGIKSIGSSIGNGFKSLFGAADGLVATRETAIRVGEYAGAATNPEIITPQNIMRDTFAETLDAYNMTQPQGNSDASARILSILEEYLPTMAQMKMVLSTGELVGALTPRLDKSLGERSQRKERGRV